MIYLINKNVDLYNVILFAQNQINKQNVNGIFYKE